MRWLIGLWLGLASACGGGGPPEPPLSCGESSALFAASSVVLQARLEVEVPTVDFGAVPLAGTETVSFLLRNSGDAVAYILPLDERGPYLEGPSRISPEAFTVDGLDERFALLPAMGHTLTVHFTPSIEGAVSGALEIASEGICDPLRVQLEGRGLP